MFLGAQSDSTVLHMDDLSLILGTSYGPLISTRRNPWAQSKG